MVELRPVKAEDAAVLQQEAYPEMALNEVLNMIAEWNTHVFAGKFFSMFAIVESGRLVGTLSLFEHSHSCASMGPDVFVRERRRGVAFSAMQMALKEAAGKGYRIIQQQVRTANTASIRLHEKLGFETDGYIYKNRHNHDVLLYLKAL